MKHSIRTKHNGTSATIDRMATKKKTPVIVKRTTNDILIHLRFYGKFVKDASETSQTIVLARLKWHPQNSLNFETFGLV